MTSETPFEQALETLDQLIRFPSVSSRSNHDVSLWVAHRLESIGFDVEVTSYFDDLGVEKTNVVGCRPPNRANGTEPSGGLAYFCHTDVVPPGEWNGPSGDPFVAVRDQDRIYGRGSCDMKGSLAAALVAAANINVANQSHPIWIVCTADEEVGFQGARELVKRSTEYRRIVAADPLAIIGEPTQMDVVHAHKGIYGFEMVSHGRAAHSSTTDGINSNVAIVPMLQTLLELGQQTETNPRLLDHRFDPPTLSWNFGIRDGGTAINITPERTTVWVTMRPMPEIDGRELAETARAEAESLGLDFRWYPGGPSMWIDPASESVQSLCKIVGRSPRTVCFGTDGGEFDELNQRVVWGPGNIEQAHTSNEFITVEQLSLGIELYSAAIRKWCC